MKLGRVPGILLALLAASLFISCSQNDDLTSGHIVVVGSESVWRVMDDEAREFMAMYGKATVRAVGTGSVEGLRLLFETPQAKETLLAVSARPLYEAERAAARKQGFDPREYKIAMDGIAIIVNQANKVSGLTLDQVRDVFSGKIRNWKELEGANRPIKVVFGQPNSATYQELNDSMLKGAGLAPDAKRFGSVFEMIKAVAADSAAIGYCGSTYLYRDWLVKPPNPEPGVKALALARNADDEAVAPDQGSIYDKSYPLWRYIYLVTRREPKGIVSGFVTFVMSSKGQQIVVADGLAPVTVKLTVKREEEE